jgi:hypothetical protein
VFLKAATAHAQSGLVDIGDDAANDLAGRLRMEPAQHNFDALAK